MRMTCGFEGMFAGRTKETKGRPDSQEFHFHFDEHIFAVVYILEFLPKIYFTKKILMALKKNLKTSELQG